jgi:cytoskeletal protein CcmA (bactofilin family)
VTILILGGLVLAPPVSAFELRSGDNILIGRGDTINDDLYAAATTITIDGTIRGDAFVAGRTIIVNGTVEGSLMAAAQTVMINGTVSGSARTAAQAVAVGPGAMIGRDLLVFAYSLETRPGSTISRDLGIGAYQALLAGAVGRNVAGAMNGLELRGSVGGNVNVEVGDRGRDGAGGGPFTGMPGPAVAIPSVPTGLTVAPTATIGGTLTYTAREQYPIAGQVAGGVNWTQRTAEERPREDTRRPLANVIQQFLTLALVGLLLLWVAPSWMERLANIVESRPLPALGWGLVTVVAFIALVIGLPLVAIVLASIFGLATLGGLAALSLGLGLVGELVLFSAFIVLTGYIAQALLSYLGGRYLLQRIRPDWVTSRAIPLVIGLLIFVVLSAIPVVGGLLHIAVAILALGAGWLWVGERLQPSPPLPPAPSALA